MAYTDPMAPPEIYHRWTALSAIAGSLRRRVWFDYGHFNLYPNMYNVLIGPPGAMKTSAMRVGQGLLSKVPGVEFSVDSITRERLIQDIGASMKDGSSPMTAYCGEFSSFFSSSGPEMAVFLTDIYESPLKWAHRTKIGGTNNLTAPCLNLQACTTAETMAKALPIHVVGLGLTSRTTFICASLPRDREWRTKKTQEQVQIEQLLLNDLQVISTLSGEYNFTPEADALYGEWYRVATQHPLDLTDDDRLRPWYSRKHTHLIKTCMTVAAAKRDELIITVDDLNLAHAILNEAEKVMSEAFSGFGASLTASPMDKIVQLLYYEKDGLTHSELLDVMKRDVRRLEFDECLETLLDTNTIIKTQEGARVLFRISPRMKERS